MVAACVRARTPGEEKQMAKIAVYEGYGRKSRKSRKSRRKSGSQSKAAKVMRKCAKVKGKQAKSRCMKAAWKSVR